VSGIFGLLDPTGVDPEELRSGAAAAAYRGDVQIQAFGSVVFGVYSGKPGGESFVVSPSSMLVADARVDGPLPGSVAERLARRLTGDELMGAILDQAGPEALDGVASDFALARWDPVERELLLARDAFGMRPLFWAQRGRKMAFAPDPSVLVALGLASGELEFAVIVEAVAGGDPAGEPTAFLGVNRVRGGHWITFHADGRIHRGRWFRPDRVPVEPLSAKAAISLVRESVVAAVASRTRGESVALSLSGGRDSGAVAVAMRHVGVNAVCLTEQKQPDTVPSETEPARELASAMGHDWCPVSIDSKVTLEDLHSIPDLAGSPIGFPSFPAARAFRDVLSTTGASVLLDGEGGDPLFAAGPIAIVDLARSGKLGMSWRSASAFRNNWRYSYPVVAKAACRALAPQHLLDLRERVRPTPPWAVASPTRRVAEPRTSRDAATAFLSSLGGSPYLELSEQFYQRIGIQYACPLYDQRVVRVALALPVELRVPIPQAKPVLSAALLGDLSSTRVKATHAPYALALAETLHADFPWLFDSDSLSARRGYVRGPVGPLGPGARWLTETRNVVPTEMWVRKMEDGHGDRGAG
jgi:asparagine synthetase B (glutamine-hydrolysing)